MRSVAFIVDHEVIDPILRHLARKEARRDSDPPAGADLPIAS
jgi:hypothetical protein